VTVVLDDVRFDPTAQRAPGAKIRILETADSLFYSEGIRTVGIDRLISSSKVTKATFYKHFGSKDRLILMYIEARHLAEVAKFESLLEVDPEAEPESEPETEALSAPTPETVLRAIVADTVAEIARPGFRGDAFLNAATEFSEDRHPVRSVVLRHREWLTGFLAELLQDLGHRMPGDAADDIILARDGAMSGGYAGDPIAATASLSRITDQVIRAAVA
jgi:AcrR family transcriptional regulator